MKIITDFNPSITNNSATVQVHMIAKFHILGVDLEDFKASGWVRNANVNLTIESTKAAKSRVDRI